MTRRGWVLLAMGLCSGGWVLPAAAEQYIEAYTDEKSYVAGETICFHVSTTSPTFSIEILRDCWTPQSMTGVAGIAGAYTPYPAYEEQGWRGVDWPVGYTMVVPETWPTGSYLAYFTTEDATGTYHPFAIRQAEPGSQSKVAFVMNYNTRCAYDRWGGKSLYFSRVPGDTHHAVRLSFHRPFEYRSGRGKFYLRQHNVYSQLEADGFALEYITEADIFKNPNLTRAYDVLVLAGHHEYISRVTYDALQGHHDRGGHLAFFSGNDIYWQIRLEDEAHTVVGYKTYAFAEDPMYGVNNDLLTYGWWLPPLNRPAEALQGIRFVGPALLFEAEDLLVQDSSHWMFAGTGLADGEPLGELLAASETDYLWEASPPVMDIVLHARRDRPLPGAEPSVEYVEAAAVYYEDSPAYGFPNGLGGQVFSSGSEAGWPAGLDESSGDYDKVRLVTGNIIQHMVAAPPAPFFADYDRDGAVDLDDFVALAGCFSGSHEAPGFERPGVWCLFTFDRDIDDDVDEGDFAEFMGVYTGPQEDCNANGVLDLEDILGDTSADCNLNGAPDECDIAGGTSADCNLNAVPDECEPDEDCNANSVQDICDIYLGTSADCNLNAVPDECEPDEDCNANSVQDICDIYLGTSADCNENLVPDDCEPPDDCNGNGVPDICDLYAGTSEDCNTDDIPDECQPDGDNDGWIDACDNCPGAENADQQDSDDDGFGDACDNCPGLPNVDQADADADGFGDACDGPGDISHDGRVNLSDFATFAICYMGLVSDPPPGCSSQGAMDCDMSGDGMVDLQDFAIFANYYGT